MCSTLKTSFSGMASSLTEEDSYLAPLMGAMSAASIESKAVSLMQGPPSLVGKLPVELLAQIFLEAYDPRDPDSCASIENVSHLWRDVSFNYPPLWTSLKIDNKSIATPGTLQLCLKRLGRSQSLPLSLTINITTIPALILFILRKMVPRPIISFHMHRVESLTLKLDLLLFKHLSYVDLGYLAELNVLNIDITFSQNSVPTWDDILMIDFRRCSKLSELSHRRLFYEPDYGLEFYFPWSQLSFLDFRDDECHPDEINQIIYQCIHLETCFFSVEVTRQSEDMSLSERPKISHSRLVAADIEFWNGSVAPVLEHLRFPALKHLSLHDATAKATIDWARPIMDLQSRSWFSLTCLRLYDMSLGPDFVALLSRLPTLEKLLLRDGLSVAVIEALVVSEDGTALLPALKDLSIADRQPSEDGDSNIDHLMILDLIKSRWWADRDHVDGPPGPWGRCSRLETAEVCLFDSYPAELEPELRRLQGEGLRLTFDAPFFA